jgi:hypothetical protein
MRSCGVSVARAAALNVAGSGVPRSEVQMARYAAEPISAEAAAVS